MHRRELLLRLPMFLVAIPALGCLGAEDHYPSRPGGVPSGGGGASDPPRGGADSFLVQNDDDSGHLHSFELTCNNLEGGKTAYTALGAHTHTVTLTDADLEAVLAGSAVTVETTAGHRHVWVVRMPDRLCG